MIDTGYAIKVCKNGHLTYCDLNQIQLPCEHCQGAVEKTWEVDLELNTAEEIENMELEAEKHVRDLVEHNPDILDRQIEEEKRSLELLKDSYYRSIQKCKDKITELEKLKERLSRSEI